MAINFPATNGQATDGTFTYVVAGITYSWNGESWTAAGGGATATDRTVFSATNDTASGGGSLAYNSNNGVFTFTPPDLSSYLTSTGAINTHTNVNHGTPSDGDLLAWNQANLVWQELTPGAGSGLDADTLDGEEGSYYRDADNLNAGTVPNARLSGLATPYDIDISGTAGSLSSLDNITDVSVTGASSGQILQYDGTSWRATEAPSIRTTATETAINLGAGGFVNFTFTTPKTYALLKIDVSHACWLTLYSDTASRTADANRSRQTDPTPGSGVLAEVITAGAASQLITPGVICFDSTGSNITNARLYNDTNSVVNLQVTLTYVPLEA